MTLEPLGDLAILVRELDDPISCARLLNAELPLGLVEAVPAYDTLGLYFSDTPDPVLVEQHLASLAVQPTVGGKLVEIPCLYDGPDLLEVAELAGLTKQEVIDLHSGREYRCYAVGFSPGFAYLGYLDDRLVLPRLSEPRLKVPPGSVAIAGRQTAVYPTQSPGGWWLIGSTNMTMVDMKQGYFAIEPGDRVRFVP